MKSRSRFVSSIWIPVFRRKQEVRRRILIDLMDFDDEDIAEAAHEAMAMTGAGFDEDDYEYLL